MPGRVYVQGQKTREGYTGHELDAETGLNYAGARYYDSAIARWMSVEPMASSYPGYSPYNYVLGDPMRLFDSIGMCPDEDPDCEDEETPQSSSQKSNTDSGSIDRLLYSLSAGANGTSAVFSRAAVEARAHASEWRSIEEHVTEAHSVARSATQRSVSPVLTQADDALATLDVARNAAKGTFVLGATVSLGILIVDISDGGTTP